MSGEIKGQNARGRRWARVLAAAALAAGAAAFLAAAPGRAGDEAKEYTIAVHVSREAPPKDRPGARAARPADAIEDLVARRVAMLNKLGGVHGRPVRAVFYDDAETLARTKENVTKSLADPNLIAMIGLWDSSRGAEVIDEIGRSGVPLISELSVETLFSDYPNIYTLTRSVRHEQQVFTSFAEWKYRRIAFVGADDDRYTRAYYDYIAASGTGANLVAVEWLKRLTENSPERIAQAVETIKREKPELIFLSLGSPKGAAFLQRLAAEGVTIPVFLGRGSVIEMRNEPGGVDAYQSPIYELAEGGIANLLNERLEQLKRQPHMRQAARKYENKPLSYGVRYGDLAALVVEAANGGAAPAERIDASVSAVREAVAEGLADLKEGRKIWRGWAQNWSFTRERASSERSLLVWRPRVKTASVLAPEQFVETGSGLTKVPVMQVHLDMLRIYRVDTSEKSFEADFFFTLRCDNGIPPGHIEFTNAYRGSGSSQRLVDMRQIHQEQPAGAERPVTQIFKVSGKFLFEPDLRKFPFDEQVFSISFQPESTSSPFLLQPPSEQLLGYKFQVDGWTIQDRYVGSNDLIIRSVAGEMSDERIIPYYNFNYTWVMKRQINDYIVRVLVPLSLILIVAYLANFIPRRNFDATIAIQVTALLSAIALYLALNQPSADDATLSDQIFVVAYVSISAMIALSIGEVNTVAAEDEVFRRGLTRHGVLRGVVYLLQIIVLPLATLSMLAYVIFLAASDFSLAEAMTHAWRAFISGMPRAAPH